eukprot:4228162-Pyramimonas_sp.AAC.1
MLIYGWGRNPGYPSTGSGYPSTKPGYPSTDCFVTIIAGAAPSLSLSVTSTGVSATCWLLCMVGVPWGVLQAQCQRVLSPVDAQ